MLPLSKISFNGNSIVGQFTYLEIFRRSTECSSTTAQSGRTFHSHTVKNHLHRQCKNVLCTEINFFPWTNSFNFVEVPVFNLIQIVIFQTDFDNLQVTGMQYIKGVKPLLILFKYLLFLQVIRN